jgi:nucleosome assembly protein 1-like 1
MSVSDHDNTCDGDYQPALDVSTLPKAVRTRVKALKKLQFATIKAETEYYREVHALDIKYQKQYDEINAKRTEVISGKHEPSSDEADWPSDQEDGSEEQNLGDGLGQLTLKDYDENTLGIPKFWLHTLKNANDDALLGIVQPHDEEILENLTDIKVSLNSPDNTGFTLSFLFKENEFFSNCELTKRYILRPDHDPESPLEYDGPEIYKCEGCPINWKEGKDVTQKTIKVKKIKAKKGSKSADKAVTKEVKIDSFFNFFQPPTVPDDPAEEMSDENRATLAIDFDVGFAIKEKIVPRAVLYFTGEILEDDEDFEDVDSDETEEEDD